MDALKYRSYIIPKRNKWRQYWEYVVMTLAIYNCLWTPLTISFDWAKYQDETNDMLVMIDWMILVLYALDIII